MRKWRRNKRLKMNGEDYIICHQRIVKNKIDLVYETFVVTDDPVNPKEIKHLRFQAQSTAEMYKITEEKLQEYSKGDYQIGDNVD